jgi:2-hydroxy-3-oxopropionate reductase
MADKLDPGFKIDLHIKDLANVLETSHQIGASLPLTGLVMEIFQSLKADGKGELDHGGVICFYKKMACVEELK